MRTWIHPPHAPPKDGAGPSGQLPLSEQLEKDAQAETRTQFFFDEKSLETRKQITTCLGKNKAFQTPDRGQAGREVDHDEFLRLRTQRIAVSMSATNVQHMIQGVTL